MARGFTLLVKGLPGFIPRLWSIPLAFLFLFLTIYLGWGEIKGLYQINNPTIVKAGQVADKILPKNTAVIAPYNGDTSFLYQINRPGWAIVGLPIKDLYDGFNTKYFVSTTKDAKTAWVMRKYNVIVDQPDYVIIDLTREKAGFDLANDIEP